MNGKMIAGKPLYVALAQRKEERRARLQVKMVHWLIFSKEVIVFCSLRMIHIQHAFVHVFLFSLMNELNLLTYILAINKNCS